MQHLYRLQQFIGNTPLFEITRAYSKKNVKIYAKLEWQQLGSSVKARPAFNIIKQAIENQEFNPQNTTLLDATSGNTGIAYATIGAALGIKIALCLPENASKERKQILTALGTKIIYTSRFEGTDGAQEHAKYLLQTQPAQYFYADQYANNNNWQAHYLHTANEIWQQTNQKITHFIAGLGTTGTFVGTARRLLELNPNIHLTALQPNLAMHGLEGWKHLETAKVPPIFANVPTHHPATIDTLQAYEILKRTAQTEGLILSPSAAANLAGAINLADTLQEGIIVTVFPDNADKYGEIITQLF